MSDVSQSGSQPRHWRLILRKDDTDQLVPIDKDTFTIGREATSDLALDDAQVSKRHARLVRQGAHLLIEDLGTANGTVVNDSPLSRPYILHSGDTIRLGSQTLTVEAIEPEPDSALPAAAVLSPQPTRRVSWLVAALAALVVITLGLGALGLILLLSSGRLSVANLPGAEALVGDAGPTVQIVQAPARDSILPPDQPIIIQTVASDASGVTRVELWANDAKVDEFNTFGQSLPSATVSFQWTPIRVGEYRLEVRAYDAAGAVSVARATSLLITDEPPTPTSTPTATPEPTQTPTARPTDTPVPLVPTLTPPPPLSPTRVTPAPTAASLILRVPQLLVRSGPGSTYASLGQLDQAEQPVIIGQTDTAQGSWWQIEAPSLPGGVGWVPADPDTTIALNAFNVPQVRPPARPTTVPAATPTPSPALAPTSRPLPSPTSMPPTVTPTEAPLQAEVIRPPAGQTLLIVENRSFANQPAILTLSGGKSVGGGRQLDVPAGGRLELVLETDFYRALWTVPGSSFSRGADFAAPPSKILVMWVVPEEGRTGREEYGEIFLNATPTATALPPTATPVRAADGTVYAPPEGQALLVCGNRSFANRYATITLSGGSMGGGQIFTLDVGLESSIVLDPGDYRGIWIVPGHGFSAGHQFTVAAGQVIFSWIVPEEGRVFMQFPGQEPYQINNQ